MAVVKNLMIRAGADFSDMEKELKKAQTSLKAAGKNLESTGKTLTAGLTVPILAAVTGLAALAKSAMDNADEIQRLSDVTGMSAETLEEFQYVGKALGVELDTITGAQTKLIKSMYAAKDGTGAQSEAFKTLGVNIFNANGELRDSQEVMGDAFDALKNIENPTLRDALSMQIFGKSARDLNPLILAGTDGLNKLTDEAHKNGAIMSNEAVSGLDEFGDTLEGLRMGFLGTFGEAFSKLAPTIQNVVMPAFQNFSETLKKIIDKFAELSLEQQGFILTMVGVLAAIGPVLSILGGLSTGLATALGAYKAFSLALTAGKGIFGALTAALGPANLVLIAVVAIAAAAYLIITNWEPISKFFESVCSSVYNAFEGAMKGIVNFFAYDIPNAFNKVVDFFKNNWQTILTFLLNPFAAAIKLLYDLNPQFKEWVDNLIKNIGDWFSSLPGEMVEVGQNLVSGLWDGITSGAQTLGKNISGFVGFIKNAFTNPQALDIHSPSKWAATVGENLCAGLAEGITNNTAMTAEAAGKLTDILKAKFDLWNATIGQTATESQKLSKELEYENAQLMIVNAQVSTAQTAYENMLSTKGELAEETQGLYAELLKELKAQADLQNQIESTTKAMQTQVAASKIWASGSSGTASYNSSTGTYTVVGNSGKVTTIGSNGISTSSGISADAPSWLSGGGSFVQSFDVGTPYVPKDMLAIVHKGEKITPAKYNNGMDSGITVNVYGSVGVDDIGEKIVQSLRRKGVKFA